MNEKQKKENRQLLDEFLVLIEKKDIHQVVSIMTNY